MKHVKRMLVGVLVASVFIILLVLFVLGMSWVTGGSEDVARRLCLFILVPTLSIVLPIMLYDLGKDLVG